MQMFTVIHQGKGLEKDEGCIISSIALSAGWPATPLSKVTFFYAAALQWG